MKLKKLMVLFIVFLLCWINTSFADNQTENNNLKIYSDSAILIENTTGKVLYEKNSNQRMYPASLTKILTAILVIEKGNLNDEVTVSKSAIADMKSGYSSAYLSENEIISVENLLKVLLIHSANDASNVLAEYISGSIPKFVDLMNSKANELGCTNTHFVSTNGLHDDNHYTTAKDLSIIARYCMKNEIFRKIVSSSRCTIPSTNKSEERYYKNTNDMLISNSPYYYPGCIGVKTGFTTQAKNCLITAVNKNGLQLIGIILGANVTDDNRSARYVDSKTLYDYAYSNFTFYTIAKESDILQTIEIRNGNDETKSLNLILENDVKVLMNKNDSKNITPEITLNQKIYAPIAANTVLGTAKYVVDGNEYIVNLLASHNVEKKENIFWILIIILILIFLTILIIYQLKKNKKYFKF